MHGVCPLKYGFLEHNLIKGLFFVILFAIKHLAKPSGKQLCTSSIILWLQPWQDLAKSTPCQQCTNDRVSLQGTKMHCLIPFFCFSSSEKPVAKCCMHIGEPESNTSRLFKGLQRKKNLLSPYLEGRKEERVGEEGTTLCSVISHSLILEHMYTTPYEFCYVGLNPVSNHWSFFLHQSKTLLFFWCPDLEPMIWLVKHFVWSRIESEVVFNLTAYNVL